MYPSRGRLAERLITLKRRIAKMQNDIADGVVVELAQFRRHSERPGADHAFEGQIALVTQVDFKEAAVILPTVVTMGMVAGTQFSSYFGLSADLLVRTHSFPDRGCS